jgi:hypothetical protein
VPAFLQKAQQSLFRLRNCIRPRDADGIEAERARLFDQRGFDLFWRS